MWPFSKRARSAPPADPLAVADVVGSIVSRTLDAQSKMLETNTSFLAQVNELAVKRAAQALGSRGGRKRAENAQRKKTKEHCPLCQDSQATKITIEDIQEHRRHAPVHEQ
jgi:hypothetical protein